MNCKENILTTKFKNEDEFITKNIINDENIEIILYNFLKQITENNKILFYIFFNNIYTNITKYINKDFYFFKLIIKKFTYMIIDDMEDYKKEYTILIIRFIELNLNIKLNIFLNYLENKKFKLIKQDGDIIGLIGFFIIINYNNKKFINYIY